MSPRGLSCTSPSAPTLGLGVTFLSRLDQLLGWGLVRWELGMMEGKEELRGKIQMGDVLMGPVPKAPCPSHRGSPLS